jgi:hypothetical protein
MAQPGPLQSAMIAAYPPPSAIAIMEEAIQRAKAMENEIDDALNECDYNAESRAMLHNCAVLGTGILKGPIVVSRMAKSWTPMSDGKTQVLELAQHTAPASYNVDVWNVYPDPSCGEDPHTGVGIFEKKNNTSKQLRELADQPGYLGDQIAKVLAKGPQLPTTTNERERRDTQHHEPNFEVWEYWGEFLPEDLQACNIEIPDGATKSISGCVIMVNDIVIKGFLNPLETGDLPYDFMQWEKVDGSCWGYGIPFLCRPAQKVLNAAWRQMMDNAGLSTGPNAIVKRDCIEPADGNWQLTGRKIWNLTDPSVDARTAMFFFDIPNNTKEFEEIIDLALKFADEESSVPMLMQGEKDNAPETLGGMQLLMNSSNVVLTRMSKQYDDSITRPHIRRYYDFFMAYSDKPEIKGDYQVDPRGATALLVRDTQQQALLQFGQFQGSGVISPMVNWQNWVKEIMKLSHIDHTGILKTDTEIAQIQAQPPQATPDQIRANAALQAAQIRAEASKELGIARMKGELAYADTEAKMAFDNHQARLQELQIKRDIAILEYASKQQITLTQAKAQLADRQMQEETKRQVASAEMQMRANEGDKDRLHESINSPLPSIQ